MSREHRIGRHMIDAAVKAYRRMLAPNEALFNTDWRVIVALADDLAEARALLRDIQVESLSPARRCDDALVSSHCRDDDGPCFAHRLKSFLARAE